MGTNAAMTDKRSRHDSPQDSPLFWEPSLAFLKLAIAFILVGSFIFQIVLLATGPETLRAILNLLLMVVAAIAWFLVARGHIRATVMTLAAGVWGYVTMASVFLGGVNSTVMIIYPLVILMAGWLISTRAALAFALLTTVTTLLFVLAESNALLPEPFKTRPQLRWIVETLVFVFSAVLIHYLVRSYRNRLEEVQSLSDDLALRTAQVQASEADLRRAQSVASVGSWIYDITHDDLQLSGETCRIFGVPEGTRASREVYLSRVHPDDAAQVREAWEATLKGNRNFDIEHRVVIGESVRWVRQKAELETGASGDIVRAVGTTQDVTERKRAEDEIHTLAFFDVLTGLPNRRLLIDRLKRALASVARRGQWGALLFIDLDHFKTLNDTLGHDFGDLLLQQVAQRLSDCGREGDSVARFGGDEFVVLLENLGESENEAIAHARIATEKLLFSLNRNFRLEDYDCRSTPSIGVSLFGGTAISSDELLKQADLAMYKAKEAGRNTIRFFDQQMQAVVTAHATLLGGLREAMSEGQFHLEYQPQVSDAAGVIGAEALLRWRHPQRGLVPPTEFVALAEETGLILPLGEWVLETACRQLAIWEAQPAESRLTLSVNVSAHQFHHPGFIDRVIDIIKRTGADPRKLKFEITESVLLEDTEAVIEKMHALRALGVAFSLDDFGTGYSSLSYLKRLPLAQLKIDRCFVTDVLIDANDAAIARMIVVLAETLGLSVIAEGVEQVEQRKLLSGMGCHCHQGYLFSRPLLLGAFEVFVETFPASAADARSRTAT